MSDAKMIIVLAVAERLKATENAIDTAVRCAAELAATLPTAWSDLDISLVVGQGAFDRSGELVSTMMQARRQAGETHRMLDAVRDRMHLPEVAWGDKLVVKNTIATVEVAGNVVSLAA